MYFPPYTEHDNVIKSALRVISATHYCRAEDPHADAEHEYAAEQLALTSRALVQAVDQKSADERPIGWSATEATALVAPAVDALPIDHLRAMVDSARHAITLTQAQNTSDATEHVHAIERLITAYHLAARTQEA